MNKSVLRKEKIQNDRFVVRHASIANIISQTYEILFPPEEAPTPTHLEKIRKALLGPETNVPISEIEAFVNEVTRIAEELVKKYNGGKEK